LALGAAFIASWLLAGWAAWLVGAFLTTVAYLVLVGVEMAVAHHMMKRTKGEMN
jgi:hypothetical protein